MMFKRKTLRTGFLIALPAIVLFNVGYFSRPENDDYFEISKNLDIFGKMYREVHTNYVDDIDPTQFMRTGIDNMLKSLDPYTNYISAAEIEEYRFASTGQYGGIGAMVGLQNGNICITEPYEGYPAAKAGVTQFLGANADAVLAAGQQWHAQRRERVLKLAAATTASAE